MLIAISFPLSYLIANYFTHAGNAIHNQLLFLIYLLVMTGYPYFIMFRN
jgi:hypothetical protein